MGMSPINPVHFALAPMATVILLLVDFGLPPGELVKSLKQCLFGSALVPSSAK